MRNRVVWIVSMAVVLVSSVAAESATFVATSRISLENGAALDNVVTGASAPVVSNESLSCDDDPQPYHAGTGETRTENGVTYFAAATRTCRQLPSAAQVFLTSQWTWDDVLVTGPAGDVPVTVNFVYQSEDSYPVSELKTQVAGAGGSISHGTTGASWQTFSHTITLSANTPQSLTVDLIFDGAHVTHLSIGTASSTFGLAYLAFDVPAGYTIDVPSAGIAGGVFPNAPNAPPPPPVPSMGPTGFGAAAFALGLTGTLVLVARRKQASDL